MHFYPILGFRYKDRKIILNTQHAMTIFRFMAMYFPKFTIRTDKILLILLTESIRHNGRQTWYIEYTGGVVDSYAAGGYRIVGHYLSYSSSTDRLTNLASASPLSRPDARNAMSRSWLTLSLALAASV